MHYANFSNTWLQHIPPFNPRDTWTEDNSITMGTSWSRHEVKIIPRKKCHSCLNHWKFIFFHSFSASSKYSDRHPFFKRAVPWHSLVEGNKLFYWAAQVGALLLIAPSADEWPSVLFIKRIFYALNCFITKRGIRSRPDAFNPWPKITRGRLLYELA